MQSNLNEPAQELALIQKYREIRVATDIDGGLGAYAAKDVVGNEDCCTTTATYITFPGVAKVAGGYAEIKGAKLFNETEDQAVQYDLHLFSLPPTGEVRDNWPNTNPIKADMLNYLGRIVFAISVANGATVATISQNYPPTVGTLPPPFKCREGSKDIYGVLVTNSVYTQTAGDAIEIVLLVANVD